MKSARVFTKCDGSSKDNAPASAKPTTAEARLFEKTYSNEDFSQMCSFRVVYQWCVGIQFFGAVPGGVDAVSANEGRKGGRQARWKSACLLWSIQYNEV